MEDFEDGWAPPRWWSEQRGRGSLCAAIGETESPIAGRLCCERVAEELSPAVKMGCCERGLPEDSL
jgi:hypothetical protein